MTQVAAGLPFDDSGRLRVTNLGAAAVPATSKSVAGLTVDIATNTVNVTSDTPSGSFTVRGMAVRADGALHVNTADAPQVVNGGVPCRFTGAVCIVNDGTPARMVNGKFTVDANSKLVVTGYA